MVGRTQQGNTTVHHRKNGWFVPVGLEARVTLTCNSVYDAHDRFASISRPAASVQKTGSRHPTHALGPAKKRRRFKCATTVSKAGGKPEKKPEGRFCIYHSHGLRDRCS